jgi:hypothetical protein
MAQNQPIIKKTQLQLAREQNAKQKREGIVSDFSVPQNTTMSPRFANQTTQPYF